MPCKATLTVAEAARRIGVHTSTLRDNWPFEATPKILVEWAVLGRAAAARRTGGSWGWVATIAGVSRRRLEQIARRRLGCTLRELDDRDGAWVERRFLLWLEVQIPHLMDRAGPVGDAIVREG